MLKIESDDGFRKIVLWNNEVPFDYDANEIMKMTIDAGNNVWHEGTICVEAKFGPWHASNYAMICMKYTYIQSQKTDIIIHYGNCYKDESTKALLNKNAVVGLDEEFANTIYETLKKCPPNSLPCGVVEVIGGAYDEVGSSYRTFECITELMFLIFSNYDKIGEASFGSGMLNKLLQK